ncbi:hypothetical protein ADK65_23950 [Streptomyces sp. NRRL B-1140]|nr:hypothetical protein ADK65_23950 [Streptomyces sp. NRRL B-1140]
MHEGRDRCAVLRPGQQAGDHFGVGREPHVQPGVDLAQQVGPPTCPVVYGAGKPITISEFTLGSVRTFGNGAPVRTYSRKR